MLGPNPITGRNGTEQKTEKRKMASLLVLHENEEMEIGTQKDHTSLDGIDLRRRVVRLAWQRS